MVRKDFIINKLFKIVLTKHSFEFANIQKVIIFILERDLVVSKLCCLIKKDT